MLKNIAKYRSFLGAEVWLYFWLNPLIGVLLFLVEYAFIFTLQGFLYSLGILAKENSLIPSWYPTDIGYSILIFFSFGALRSITLMLRGYISNMLQLSFTFHQRANLLNFGLKNIHQISSKEIVSLFSESIAQAGAVVSNASLLINMGVSAIFFFAAGLHIAPVEMLLSAFLLSLFLYPLKYTTKKISGQGAGITKEWFNVSESLLAGLKNNFFLSIYHQVNREIEVGTTSLEKSKKHYISYSFISNFITSFPLLIGLSVLCFTTYIGSKYVHTESIKLISFFYLFIRLAQSVSDASGAFSRLQFSLPAMRILYKWNIKFDEVNNQQPLPTFVITDSNIQIEATDLSFKYEKSPTLFEELNFSIKNSDVLVIKGESGTGKSTLLSVILGLLPPTKGQLKINNHTTHEHTLDLHKVLAYVGPEPYLIQGTVKENLLYGLNHQQVSEEALWDALEMVELKDLIINLPLSLNEPIHDIPQLSSGQKQRLSFARALVRKPSLLILDEATANLDVVTEKKIIENLKDIFKKCTCIIVTHKNSFDDLATATLDLQNMNKTHKSHTEIRPLK